MSPNTSSTTTSPILTSRYPTPPLPSPSTSLFHFYLPADLQRPDDLAFVSAENPETSKYTRKEFRVNALRLGAGLKAAAGGQGGQGRALGGQPQQQLALVFSPNSIHYPLIFFGLQSILTIASLANASYTSKELCHQLRDGKPTVLFVHPALWSIAQESLEILIKEKDEQGWISQLRVYYTVPTSELSGAGEGNNKNLKPAEFRSKEIKSFDSLYVDESDLPRGWAGDELDEKEKDDRTAVLCYSSGTTALPKGVSTTHRNLSHVAIKARELLMPLVPGTDKIIGVLPFFHIYGMVNLVCFPLLAQIPCYTLPRFEPLLFLQTIEKQRITWALLVPPILVILANLPLVDSYDLSSLRSLMSGAAPLGEGLTKKALARLRKGGKKGPGNPDLQIVQGYGLTETTAPCMCTRLEDAERKIGSAGQLIPGTEAKLVDLDGNTIPIEFDDKTGRSKAGEFCLRGSTVMKGYWRNPEATKGTFLDGGWYRTGDIAEVDRDGFFFIVDRLKELIKYKGFQVPPADLEALLLTHPEIDDCGVIGVMSEEQATELPRAYVVPRGGLGKWASGVERKRLEEEIVGWVAKSVANHKRLRGGVVFLEAIPKSPAGKILRRELRDLAKVDDQHKSSAFNSTQQKITKL